MYLLSDVAYTIINVQNKYKLSNCDNEVDFTVVAVFISEKGGPLYFFLNCYLFFLEITF